MILCTVYLEGQGAMLPWINVLTVTVVKAVCMGYALYAVWHKLLFSSKLRVYFDEQGVHF